MLGQLGRWAFRWRVPVLLVWAVVAVVGAVLGGGVYDRTSAVDALRPDVEASLAAARLERLDPEGELVVGVLSGRDARSTELVDSAGRVLEGLSELPGVAEVTDAYTSDATDLVADDRQGSLVLVELDPALDEDESLEVADDVAAVLRTIDVPQVLVGGELLAQRAFAEQATTDAVRGETAALVVLLVLLVVVLGSVLAGALPLLAALATIATTLLALSALAGTVPVSEYAVNVVTVLGLGLAVDYSLLVLARFREERANDPRAPLPELLARTTATAGRAVLVSGLAVGTAMVGLFALADPLLSAMALGGFVVVVLATITALTLVPALLAVAHRRLPAPGAGRWRRSAERGPGLLARTTAFAQRHATPVALLTAAGLVVLALPLSQLAVGNSDARTLPAGAEARAAAEAVDRDFSSSGDGRVTVLVDAAPGSPAATAVLDQLRQLTGERDLDLRDDLSPGLVVVELEPSGAAAGDAAQRLVQDVRALDADVPVLVTGPAAELVDGRAATLDRLPVAVAVVVLAAGLLLLALTGSLVVPAKALLLNLLSLAATLGVLVAVFQWGWGADLLGFDPVGTLDLTTPLLLFMFAFGLSMDYEVFLLARIKEEWDRRPRDGSVSDRVANDRAVLDGVTASGPVVTTAAVAIGIVFLGFAAGELVPVKEIGVGMAVALLLDVTVVRGLLLPALMHLLGGANWWGPSLPGPRTRGKHEAPARVRAAEAGR